MQSTTTGRLRIAIVGAGYVASHHLAALKRLDFVDVVGICDPDSAAAHALANKFAIPVVAARLADLAVQSPDAVYVLTPPASHCAIALEALDMGCHVLVEKPMAESVAECTTMIDRARERDLVISVNHSDRLDPVVVKALDAVRDGAIGDLLSVDILRSSEYPDYAGGPLPAAVRQGSYPFRDLGVHGLYVLEAFLGTLTDVDARYRATGRDPNLKFDEWHASANGPGGLGRMLLSWNARPMESRLVVRGTRGIIEVDRFLQICRIHRVLPGPKFIGIVATAFLSGFADVFRVPWNVVRFATGMLRPSPGIQAGAAGFATALHTKTAPPIPAEEGLRAVALMEQVCAGADAERSADIEARFVTYPPVDVLVTGAAGFLGRAVVTALRARGKTVRVLVRNPAAAKAFGDDVQVLIGDLGDPRSVSHAVDGARQVFHVGAAMRGSPRAFEAGTVWGTRNVIDACLAYAVQRLVYVSSLSVLDHAGRDPAATMNEQSALEPEAQRRGAYTQTKLTAETLVRAAIREKRLPAVIIRPGQIFGPGAERVTPNGTLAIAGRWIAVGEPSQTLPLVYLDDIVDALLLAADSEPALGQTINVVDPTGITQQAYLDRVKHKLGSDLRLSRVSVQFFMVLAQGVELLGKALKRDVPLTRYRVRSLRPLANFDIGAARTLLGWQPRVGVERGLDVTFGPAPVPPVPPVAPTTTPSDPA
ncbi:MAG: NAD-dependent epimerase/dehydratase family protein [Dokdonella sp.]|uniref:NAD-dependent epimerase/dehydratase family protein n=1 Tax=Dokdonella sp. TaxID=2291710 RepID=UPI00326349F1